MPPSKKIDLPLIHRPTGRSAAILPTQDFWEAEPVFIERGCYVLLIVSEKGCAHSKLQAARAWIDAGAAYVCAWGPHATDVEETFDYAAFLPEVGGPLPFTLMTTSHQTEELSEALWFAFHNAMPPDDLGHALESVVIVVDSDELEARCLAWVGEAGF